jgi:hypothetical protein
VTHLISFGFLHAGRAVRMRDLGRSAASPGVRWSRGVSKTFGAEGAANGGSTHHGMVVTGVF